MQSFILLTRPNSFSGHSLEVASGKKTGEKEVRRETPSLEMQSRTAWRRTCLKGKTLSIDCDANAKGETHKGKSKPNKG